jgi:hypothetical protein
MVLHSSFAVHTSSSPNACSNREPTCSTVQYSAIVPVHQYEQYTSTYSSNSTRVQSTPVRTVVVNLPCLRRVVRTPVCWRG